MALWLGQLSTPGQGLGGYQTTCLRCVLCLGAWRPAALLWFSSFVDFMFCITKHPVQHIPSLKPLTTDCHTSPLPCLVVYHFNELKHCLGFTFLRKNFAFSLLMRPWAGLCQSSTISTNVWLTTRTNENKTSICKIAMTWWGVSIIGCKYLDLRAAYLITV